MRRALPDSKVVGIIGFGAGGLSYFVQLIDSCIKNNRQISIDIFEKSELSKGLAYGGMHGSHILNLNSHVMSISHTKPDNFYEWLQKEKSNWIRRYPYVTPKDLYPPRPLFGEYLEYTFLQYLDIAKKHDIRVTVYKTEIIDLTYASDNKINIHDGNAEIYVVDVAMLALGNFPSDNYSKLNGKIGYHHSPWESIKIDGEGPVVILGTRLTSIDTALYLTTEKKIKNKIYLVSRSGSLPKIIGPSKPYDLSFFNKKNVEENINENGNISLAKLGQLFKQEIEFAEGAKMDWDKIRNTKPSTFYSLDEEIKIVDKGKFRPWQSTLIALYPFVPWIWSLLNTKDKKIFINKYLSIWLTYLAAFPPQNAKKLRKLMKSGSVEIIAGLTKIEHISSKFIVSFDKFPNIVTHTLINATGSGHNSIHSKLLTNMIRGGIINRSIIGGLDIDVKTCRLVFSDVSDKRDIFAIGEITFGSWLATADLGQISRQAEIAVNDLLNKMQQ